LNKTVAPGQVLPYSHSAEERAPYKASCSVHPWMTSWILPRNNGYFAKTDAQGNFTIADLPTGVELTFKVWQEKVGAFQDVTVNGQSMKWPKTGFKQTLQPEQTLTLDVEVDAAPFTK
ncbi:MAG: hypothetical protein KDA41_17470, partial [Planctomycetales bacterium]|nr:hypothetical protein [Planctomycetales bacterium]